MADTSYSTFVSAIEKVFSGSSAACRAKKAAATHLLNYPDRNTSSPVATAVKYALGGPTKSYGLPPFRELLQQDPCFIVHKPFESEACIELNKANLLAAAARTTGLQRTVSSASSSSSLPTSATTYHNYSSLATPAPAKPNIATLKAAAEVAFPGTYAAARAKRAAAIHLILHPERNCSSPVSVAVRGALGASTKSLGLPPFRQLLAEDACFKVHDAQASEAVIKLDTAALLSTAQSNIQAAIAGIYSSSAPEIKVRRAAAQHLAEQSPHYRDKCARVAAAVDAVVGSPAKLGLSLKFREIVATDPCFKLTPSPVLSEVYLKLNAKLLLQLHQQQQTPVVPTPLPSTLPSSAAAALPPPQLESLSFPPLPGTIKLDDTTQVAAAAAAPAAAAALSPKSWASVAISGFGQTARPASSASAPSSSASASSASAAAADPAADGGVQSSSAGEPVPCGKAGSDIWLAAYKAFEAAALSLMPPDTSIEQAAIADSLAAVSNIPAAPYKTSLTNMPQQLHVH